MKRASQPVDKARRTWQVVDFPEEDDDNCLLGRKGFMAKKQPPKVPKPPRIFDVIFSSSSSSDDVTAVADDVEDNDSDEIELARGTSVSEPLRDRSPRSPYLLDQISPLKLHPQHANDFKTPFGGACGGTEYTNLKLNSKLEDVGIEEEEEEVFLPARPKKVPPSRVFGRRGHLKPTNAEVLFEQARANLSGKFDLSRPIGPNLIVSPAAGDKSVRNNNNNSIIINNNNSAIIEHQNKSFVGKGKQIDGQSAVVVPESVADKNNKNVEAHNVHNNIEDEESKSVESEVVNTVKTRNVSSSDEHTSLNSTKLYETALLGDFDDDGEEVVDHQLDRPARPPTRRMSRRLLSDDQQLDDSTDADVVVDANHLLLPTPQQSKKRSHRKSIYTSTPMKTQERMKQRADGHQFSQPHSVRQGLRSQTHNDESPINNDIPQKLASRPPALHLTEQYSSSSGALESDDADAHQHRCGTDPSMMLSPDLSSINFPESNNTRLRAPTRFVISGEIAPDSYSDIVPDEPDNSGVFFEAKHQSRNP